MIFIYMGNPTQALKHILHIELTDDTFLRLETMVFVLLSSFKYVVCRVKAKHSPWEAVYNMHLLAYWEKIAGLLFLNYEQIYLVAIYANIGLWI